MADSDYSVSESSGKGSSTTTTNDLPSGNTSENEKDGNRGLCGESPARNSEANLVNTEIRFELDQQHKEPTLTDTENDEQIVKPEIDKQEALMSKEISSSDTDKSTMSKVGMEKQEPKLQNTETCENAAKSHDSSSSNSASSATIIEKKCDISQKEKDESSSGQNENVQDRTSSNPVS